MITKIYRVFQYHRKLFVIMSLFFISCEAQTLKDIREKNNFSITYIKFDKDDIYDGLYQLKFEILNNTDDTIFLNEDQIGLTCKNGKKELQNEYMKFSKNLRGGQRIVIPEKLSESEIADRLIQNKVKEQYIDNYLKNNNIIDKLECQTKKKQMMQQLIVVFPKGSIEYKTEFYNELFTQETVVNLDCKCILKQK